MGARLLSVAAFLPTFAASLSCSELQPYVMDWKKLERSPVGAETLLDAPAGHRGFIGIRDGHLALPDGKRFRIWGINLTMGANLPLKEDAPRIAAKLAQFGINCVRLHFLDSISPNGLIRRDWPGTNEFDPDALDRFDYFFSLLKQHGIYADLNLNVARTYRAADKVKEHDRIGFGKWLTYFDPRLIELQKEYASDLLGHRNPYTGLEYRHEPAIALIEIVNENSLVDAWAADQLGGLGTPFFEIPLSYELDLTRLYNRWLRARMSETEWKRLAGAAGAPPEKLLPRMRRTDFFAPDKERFYREAEFYIDTERRFFAAMREHLRNRIGARHLLIASSVWEPTRSPYPFLTSTSDLDVIDAHAYWREMRRVRSEDGAPAFPLWRNRPMVNDPANSTVVELSRAAFYGKPFLVSEVNHPFPNDYAAEGIPILAAYASFQDWDGVIWYSLERRAPNEWENAIEPGSNLATNPIKMPVIIAGAFAFLRGDIKPALRTVARSYSQTEVYESIRLGDSSRPYFTPEFPNLLPLRHGSRIRSLRNHARSPFPAVHGPQIRSDTGELTWDTNADNTGAVIVDTARTQFLVGFLGQRTLTARNLAAAVSNRFCALTLTACDERPIADSALLLLTATARVENSAMQWGDPRAAVFRWGTEPTVIEPVRGLIRLRGIVGAKKVTVRALDGAGAGNEKLQASLEADEWHFRIGSPVTTWWRIEIAR